MKTKNKIEVEKIDILSLPSLPVSNRKDLPNVAAIYLIATLDDKILYIGETEHLVIRLSNHSKLKLEASHPNLKIIWLECSDLSLLKKTEKALIDRFNPPYNRNNSPIPSRLYWMPNSCHEHFIANLIKLLGLTPLTGLILIEFLNNMDSRNCLLLNDKLTNEIALSLNLSIETIGRCINKLVESSIADKVGYKKYQFKDSLFGDGVWKKAIQQKVNWEIKIRYKDDGSQYIKAYPVAEVSQFATSDTNNQ
jgi:hypothetical protein